MDRILSFLGIAAKSGNIKSGEFSSAKAVKEAKGYLVIVAGDASDNTKKEFINTCKYYKVPYCEYSNKECLGRSIGKKNRASLCITDNGMALALINKLNEAGCKVLFFDKT